MILKLTNGEYIHVDSYGCNSWGTLNQDSIKKRNGKWYIESDICVDSREDRRETIITPLDVEEELAELPDGASIVNEDDLETFYRMVFNIHSSADTSKMSNKEMIEAVVTGVRKDLNATEALLYDIYTLELTHEIAYTDGEGIERYEKVGTPVGIKMRAVHTDNALHNKENLRESFDSFVDCLYEHIFGESKQREEIPKEPQDIEQGWRKVADILYKNTLKCTPCNMADWSDTLKKMYGIGERPKGEWIERGGAGGYRVIECSLCRSLYGIPFDSLNYNYCPNCGAKFVASVEEQVNTKKGRMNNE